ncbi:MAG: polymerase sigma-70 factor [Solirubrobacterales bacterium]|nr:polymerase sigma-70 factor [Solirubrobacterales bacterium]
MAVADYADLRPLLFSIAYRMTGTVGDAEDIVQEAFLRYHRRDGETAVETPRAWLATVTTRLAIDHLRSARVRREAYVGPWLPEPLLTGTAEDPGARAEMTDSLSVAFLAVLERLSPVERAVFLLREVFDYGFDEIAAIVEKSEDNCRQLLVRARRHVDAERPRFPVSAAKREELTERFLAACQAGDLEALTAMLAADAAAFTDGGGKARAASRAILGARAVARFMALIASRTPPEGIEIRPARINGQPGRLLLDATGQVFGALVLDVGEDDAIVRIDLVVNPEKLRRVAVAAR